jgi:hypothetical protein
MSYVFIVAVLLVPVLSSFFAAKENERFRLAALILCFGIFFLILLWLLNDNFEFSGGGDDLEYFRASQRTFTSLGQWFDLQQFSQTHAQGGYPLLLTWVHQFSGGSLYARKVLNIFFLLELGVVWYTIGEKIGGRQLAFTFAVGILLGTPLWYYWIYLLKDMTIAFLQSLFILGLMLFVSQGSRLRGYVVIAISTILLLPFRSLLVLVNIAVMPCCMFVQNAPRRSPTNSIWKLILIIVFTCSVLVLASNPHFLERFGAKGQDRAVGTKAIDQWLNMRRSQSYVYRFIKFPLVFLVGEVSALNPGTAFEGEMNTELIRGMLWIPWMVIGLPLFFAGIGKMLYFTKQRAALETVRAGAPVRMADQSAVPPAAPADEVNTYNRSMLLVCLIFTSIYVCLSWISADTVRWRISSLPPMISIAGFGWATMSPGRRFGLLLPWGLFLFVFVAIYYLFFH